MYSGAELLNIFLKESFDFVTGVPCSILKSFLIEVNVVGKINHVVAASEGEAMGIAAGYHLATGKIPLVYMQNSGLGNAVNPLTSLSDPQVYGIPTFLLISWRGEPEKPDEPQHKKMGLITDKLLEALGVPYEIASDQIDIVSRQIATLKNLAINESRPVALIVKKENFAKNEAIKNVPEGFTRERALKIILGKTGDNIVVATTGKTSREIFEIRENSGQSHERDFLTVGSMGCASGIGLGIALNSNKKIFVIDGDGAVLMKMGTLATIGFCRPENFTHIVIDNGAYESTGGQPTVSPNVNWRQIFDGAGYAEVLSVGSEQELALIDFGKLRAPTAIIIKTIKGARPDLGRPTITPAENKKNFMKKLHE